MRLVELDVRNYRSIKSQSGESSISLRGLDCLVGKNNAGKTNVLSAIKFLLEEEEKSLNDELYWGLDPQLTVEVRGFFEVTEEDLSRIEDPEKRDDCRELLVDRGEYEGMLGICRVEDEDQRADPKFRRLAFRPEDDRLSVERLKEYRKPRWNDKQDPDKSFGDEDYATAMEEEYPEVAELIPSGKRSQQKIWVNKIKEYIKSNPSDVNYTLQPAKFPDGTKERTRERLLPEVIPIPALREVSSAMNRGGEFGNLIQQIQSEIQEELDNQLREEVADFEPAQHDGIARIEGRISEYLGRTFSDQSVKIGFPNLSTEYLFRSADIKIQEEHLDEISKENVGEGVKRTVIFSLLRTLADLRAGRLNIGDTKSESDSPPFLILYEEAELFLHPSLQRRLLGVLEDFSADDSQVVFSTHSPIMIQQDQLDTINVVRKDPEEGSLITQFHRVLEEFTSDDAERARLTQMERVSSYIFADSVVLVEGISDRIFIEKVAPHLDSEWDFDGQSIPVLDVGGKKDVRMFYQFLKELDIDAHCILDIDAIEDEVPQLVNTEELAGLVRTYNDRVAEEVVEPAYSEKELGIAVASMPWDDDEHPDAFSRIEDMMTRVRDGEELTEDDADVLEKVLAKSEQTEPSRDDFLHPELQAERMEIVEHLLERNVLLLSGEIEDYFPRVRGSRSKRQNALLYDPADDDEVDHQTDRFSECESYGMTDVEVFLNQVFRAP